MNRVIASFLISAVIGLAAPAAGQDGLALMKVDPGARPSGMGGAFVSIAGDPMASAFNPAGAVGSEQFVASLGHNDYWENIRLETGYFSARWSERLYLHGGIRFAAVDDLESRLTPTAEPEGLFDAHDVSLKAGVAYKISDKIAAGVAAGWFIEKIESWRGSAFNIDLGLIGKPRPGLTVGASVTNLGSDFTLGYSGRESAEISLPTAYRFGASYQYQRYLGAVDLVYLDDDAHVHVGAEARLHEYLSLRAGYMSGYDVKDLTAGASFHLTRYRLAVDYAFVPYSDNLGTYHLINLTFEL